MKEQKIVFKDLATAVAKLKRASRYDEALAHLHSALPYFENRCLWDHYFEVWDEIRNIKNDLAQYEEVIRYCKANLDACKKLLGVENGHIGDIYNDMGASYGFKGDRIKQLSYHLKSLKVRRKVFGENDLSVAFSYNNVGVSHHNLGDIDKALLHYNKAIAICIQHPRKQIKWLSSLYNNLAAVFSLKQEYDSALAHYGKSLEHAYNYLGKNHVAVMFTLNNIGHALYKKGDFPSALRHFNRAYSLVEKNFNGMHSFLGTICINKANCHSSIRQNRKAIYYLKKAEDILDKTFGKKHPTLSLVYNSMGRMFMNKGDNEQALRHFQTAIICLCNGFNDTDYRNNPPLDCIISEPLMLEILTNKARALFDYYENQTKDLLHLKNSFETSELAIGLIERMRKKLTAEDSKLTLTEQSAKVFECCVNSAAKLYFVKQEEEYLAQAFRISEKNKVAVLSGLLADSSAKFSSKIPTNMLVREKKLKTEMTFLSRKINEEKMKGGSSAPLQWLQGKYFDAFSKYETLIKSFEKSFPDYYRLKYNHDVASMEAIQSKLGSDEAMVEYLINTDRIFIYLITKSSADLFLCAKPREFEGIISQLLSSINHFEKRDFIEAAIALYQLLLKPAENIFKGKRRLIIISEGSLCYVPFEALLPEQPDYHATYNSLPYLVNRYAVSYHYSATLFLQQFHVHETALYKNDFLGIAPVYEKPALIGKDVFPNLLHSKKEVEDVSSIVRKNRQRAKILLLEEATINNFRRYAKRSKFVLVSAHQAVNEREYLLSGIIFSSQHSLNDYQILTISEAYNLEINADLVVLNCCETGIGKLAKGEGMMALNRGFLYAGARNIIYTLFKIPDNSAGALTKSLFTRILSGESYSKALQEAKLELIARPEFTPKAWAGYVMIGE